MDEPERSESPRRLRDGGPVGAAPAGDRDGTRASRPVNRDPAAVAIGNASLLSAGYVLLGWRWRAAGVGLVTFVLVLILATAVRTVWFEFVVLGWWLALIVHGWLLAGGWPRRRRRTGNRSRLITALALALPVLVAFALLRFDVARINGDVASAVRDGDCARATAALDDRSPADYLADAPGAVHGRSTGRACAQIATAADQLNLALGGDGDALTKGLGGLRTVLAQEPGHEAMVDRTLDSFLGHLPVPNACDTETILDGLRGQGSAAGDRLARAAGVVPRLAPAAIVGCGDSRMASSDWEQARTEYGRPLERYPGDPLAVRATDGVRKAGQQIELAQVRGLLGGAGSGTGAGGGGAQPAYCANPAPYSGAAPGTGGGLHPALLVGDNTYVGKLPAEWWRTDVADAALVVCAGAKEMGDTVRSCSYSSTFNPFGAGQSVAFHKIAIPVKVIEVLTGHVVSDQRVQVNGASCPETVHYTTSTILDTGPPPDMYVDASDDAVVGGVRAALGPVIAP